MSVGSTKKPKVKLCISPKWGKNSKLFVHFLIDSA